MVEDFKSEYPTWGDLAREQLRRRGFPYSGDVREQIREQLGRLPMRARKAFAVSCAERLMVRHQNLPQIEQRPFTLGWRPALDAIWEGLNTENEDYIRQVQAALDAFYASPYYHTGGQDGPDDAIEDAALGSIYACECFVHGTAEFHIGPLHVQSKRHSESLTMNSPLI